MELVSVFPVSLGRELAILLLSVSQDTGLAFLDSLHSRRSGKIHRNALSRSVVF